MKQIIYLYAVLDFSNIVIDFIKAPNDFKAYNMAKLYYGNYNIYISRIK